MKGKRAAVFALFIALLAAPALAGPTLSFKFYGGAGYWPTGGDFKELFESTAARWDYTGSTGTFDLDWKPIAYEGGVQAVLALTPRFSLALGVGYLVKNIDQAPRLQDGPLAEENIDRTYRLSAFPVTLDVLYAVTTGALRLNLSAGLGVYPTHFLYEAHSQYSDSGRPAQPNWTWDVRENFDSETTWAKGVHFGLGAEFRLTEKIFLCLDAFYRMASFDKVVGHFEWSGVQAWTGGGESYSSDVDPADVWYSESIVWGQLWHYIDFAEDKPTTSDDARLFKFDLGGPVVRIGIRIGL